MDFEDYQRSFNALFAADHALNQVCAYPNDPPAVEAGTVDAFQLLRLALSMCVDRLGRECLRRCPESETPDVGELLDRQRRDGFTLSSPVRDILCTKITSLRDTVADHAHGAARRPAAWPPAITEEDPIDTLTQQAVRVVGLEGADVTVRCDGQHLIVTWHNLDEEDEVIRYRPLGPGEAPLHWHAVFYYGHVWNPIPGQRLRFSAQV